MYDDPKRIFLIKFEIKIRGPARKLIIIPLLHIPLRWYYVCSEGLLTHLFFPGCVKLVGDLAHLECSPSDPPYLGPTWGNIDKNRQKKIILCQKNTLGRQKLDLKKTPEATPWPSKGALKKNLGWIWLKTTREGCKVSKKRKTWLDLA